MKLANPNGEIWMVTDRRQVPDLVSACLNASAVASTILLREKDWSVEETANFCFRFHKHWIDSAVESDREVPQSPPLTPRKPQLVLNWNGQFDPSPLPIQGLHLGFDVACQVLKQTLPLHKLVNGNGEKPPWKLGASLHNQKEWEILKNLPLDYVILSNIFSTSCKPNKEGLGLAGTERLLKTIQKDRPLLQAYGLGGLKITDLDSMTALGLQGIVLRSAFF